MLWPQSLLTTSYINMFWVTVLQSLTKAIDKVWVFKKHDSYFFKKVWVNRFVGFIIDIMYNINLLVILFLFNVALLNLSIISIFLVKNKVFTSM